MKTKLLFLLNGILVLGVFLAFPVFAQQPAIYCENSSADYFSETSHNVCGAFFDFFDARGGLEIFGYPLTEAFVDGEGRTVQYFQRVRMEYHPENPPEYQVQLGLLGDVFAPSEQKARIPASQIPSSNDRERRYFPETGHTVGLGFLKFYDENGGLDNFGYPVTEFILENGRFVQYFQRAVMEWRPNQGRIALQDLGQMWIDQHKVLQGETAPAREFMPGDEGVTQTVPSVTSLHATASVRDAFTGRGGYQTVWVYVYDQSGEPVQGAEVQLYVRYLSGDRIFDKNTDPRIPPTDKAGHTQITFELGRPQSGRLVLIDAYVNYQGVETKAQTSFFPWW